MTAKKQLFRDKVCQKCAKAIKKTLPGRTEEGLIKEAWRLKMTAKIVIGSAPTTTQLYSRSHTQPVALLYIVTSIFFSLPYSLSTCGAMLVGGNILAAA